MTKRKTQTHTPGPWFVHNREGQYLIHTPYKTTGITGMPIARLVADAREGVSAEANAKLIAMAPEMIQALEACHDVLWNGYAKDSPVWLAARSLALNAIRRAKNET